MDFFDDHELQRFRLLTEYHSFLQGRSSICSPSWICTFPSPYGVSFILTLKVSELKKIVKNKFPSPYGVSFILTYVVVFVLAIIISCFRLLTEYHSFLHARNESWYMELIHGVSVSLRSIIHSYIISLSNNIINFINGVSVSLRSIIHSYSIVIKV